DETIAYLEGTDRFADRAQHPLPGVLILDLRMPGRSGFEVLEWLRAQPKLRRLPVVVTTAPTDTQNIARARELGADSYLLKPTAPDALLAALHEMGVSTTATAAVPRDAHGAGAGAAVAPARTRVALVDDNPDDRRLQGRLIRKAFPDFEIVEVADAAAWGALLEAGTFDIVVTDAHLGWSDGITIGRTVRERWPHRPVIMVTGTGSEEIAVAAIQSGFEDYVLKSHDRINRLPTVIRGAIERASGRALDRTSRLKLEQEIDERSRLVASLARIHSMDRPEDTAAQLCSEARTTLGVGLVAVAWYLGDAVMMLALDGPDSGPTTPGQLVPAHRSAYLRQRAMRGPWVEEWTPEDLADPYIRAWSDAGVQVAAYVAIVSRGVPQGIIIAGSGSRWSMQEMNRRMPALVEYAAVAAALIEPGLTSRTASLVDATATHAVIAAGAYKPVFQPIIGLASKVVAGYEALTRFDDGVSPAVHFATARAAGVGPELELATLEAALRAATALPLWAFLSVNVSAALLMSSNLGDILAASGRPIVLELTEHEAGIESAKLVEIVKGLGDQVQLAVDDTGAGYAGLQRVLELRPQFVKLDIELVRNIDRDAAREALIAGMVHFARETDAALIAEGIEREGERRALRRLGVSFGQGYLLGRPAPVATWAAPEKDAS
ncbi:MAG: diguanylate cyclase/phosphodiesterase & domain with sensor(s), partial [Chloroflexi bacterium]|nr:diguanylate cyclase/phosphodiesterase & domain with sensor(s) [Chloroflexota bacterium]